MEILKLVADLTLPDCWVAAGFVRNAVWDDLHERSCGTQLDDVDVVYFDPEDSSRSRDCGLERLLQSARPDERFAVKNQARMHERNAHARYQDTTDAIRYWPETCTAVGVQLATEGIKVTAPYGLGDLFDLLVRPTSTDAETVELVRRRLHSKEWQRKWPQLRLDPSLL